MKAKVNFLCYNVVLLDLLCIFVETNKQIMIELVLGGFIYWIITKIEEKRKIKKRLKDAKEKVFTQDYPQYYTSH